MTFKERVVAKLREQAAIWKNRAAGWSLSGHKQNEHLCWARGDAYRGAAAIAESEPDDPPRVDAETLRLARESLDLWVHFSIPMDRDGVDALRRVLDAVGGGG